METLKLGLFLLSFYVYNATTYEVVPVRITPPLKYGDGGLWDALTNSLYFVDAGDTNGRICRFDYNINIVFCAYINGAIGLRASFLVPVEGWVNKFVAGIGRKAVLILWSGYTTVAFQIRTVFDLGANPTNNIMRARCDAAGRLFFGTADLQLCGAPANSAFYVYSPQQGVQPLSLDLKTTTGIVLFTTNYIVDGCKKEIREFGYNAGANTIKYADKSVYNYTASYPVGLDVDHENLVFSSAYGEGQVLKIDTKTSNVLTKYDMPVKGVTSPIFCGANMDVLCVTSSSSSTTGQDGWLFKITGTGSKGFPDVRMRVT